MEAYTLANFLADIGSVVTAAVSWMTSVVGFIHVSPIVLTGFILLFVGFAVGLLMRLVRG